MAYEAYSWQSVMPRVTAWLEEVKRDLQTPDLWAELQREAELLLGGSDDDAENTPFTLDEQKEIARRLREAATYVKSTYSFSAAQAQALDAKVDYLVRAAGRSGRIDWRNILVSAIVSVGFAAALPPESIRDIFATLANVVGDLIALLASP